jgi:ketosteroid isomerase-like protein
MKQNSDDEQALIKVQHDWAEVRIKGDSSYTRRLEAENCTVVWPDGSIVNKREDLKSMTGDIVFTEFKIDDLQVRLYGDTGIVVGQGTIEAHERKAKSSGREIRLDGYIYKTRWRMESGRLTSNSSLKEINVNDRRYSL